MTNRLQPILSLLREHDWPIPEADLADLTFEYSKSDIPFLRNEAVAIRVVGQLRPIPSLNFAVFLIDSMHRQTPNRFALRRIAMYFATTRPHFGQNRNYFDLNRQLFIVLCDNGSMYVAHFTGGNGVDAPMARIGPLTVSGPSLKALYWSKVLAHGIEFETDEYTRHERRRSPQRCDDHFLRRHSPDHLPLFKTSKSVKGISQIEEDLLFYRTRLGDISAREKITKANIGRAFDISYAIFKAYARCCPAFDEIFGGVILGLFGAIPLYEPSRSNRFSSFSWAYMYQAGVRSMVKALKPYSLPLYVWEPLAPVIKECSVGCLSLDDSRATNSLVCISDYNPVRPDHDLLTSLTNTEMKPTIQMLRAYESQELNRMIGDVNSRSEYVEILNRLPPRERDVLSLRLGLTADSDFRQHTLDEVGIRFCITRERVRQIELRAVKKIQKLLIPPNANIPETEQKIT